jgi:hypothetical protein
MPNVILGLNICGGYYSTAGVWQKTGIADQNAGFMGVCCSTRLVLLQHGEMLASTHGRMRAYNLNGQGNSRPDPIILP